MDVRSLVAVLLAGMLAGSELTSWGVVHPTLWKLDYQAQVHAEKLIYRRFASVDPFLMTATVVACFVAVGGLDGSSARLALAAGACFAGMLAITLVGNMPLNLRVRPDPARQRGLRPHDGRRPRRLMDPRLGARANDPRRCRARPPSGRGAVMRWSCRGNARTSPETRGS